MDVDRIFAQYQKYIAITERLHLHTGTTRQLVLAGSFDLLPSPELLELEGAAPEMGKREIWRPIEPQEVVTRIRLARN